MSGRVDPFAPPHELPGGELVLLEDAADRLQVELRGHVHDRAVLVVEVLRGGGRRRVPGDEVAVEPGVRGQVPLRVHRHERRQLRDAGIDAPAGAGVPARDRVDQPALEEGERLGGGPLVDAVRVHPGVDRPGHEGHAARLGDVVPRGEQGDRRQHGDGGLTDRHDVGVRSELAERLDDVLDVLVEPERSVLDRDVPGVVPVEDVHVVVAQEGADRRPDQGREVPRHGSDDEDPRLTDDRRLVEVQQRGERCRDHRALDDLDLPIADEDPVDAERRALMGRTCPGEDVADGPHLTHAGGGGERCRQRVQRPGGQLGGGQNGCRRTALDVVRGVEHGPACRRCQGADVAFLTPRRT